MLPTNAIQFNLPRNDRQKLPLLPNNFFSAFSLFGGNCRESLFNEMAYVQYIPYKLVQQRQNRLTFLENRLTSFMSIRQNLWFLNSEGHMGVIIDEIVMFKQHHGIIIDDNILLRL